LGLPHVFGRELRPFAREREQRRGEAARRGIARPRDESLEALCPARGGGAQALCEGRQALQPRHGRWHDLAQRPQRLEQRLPRHGLRGLVANPQRLGRAHGGDARVEQRELTARLAAGE